MNFSPSDGHSGEPDLLSLSGQTMSQKLKTKFCIHIIIDKIYVGIIKHHFSELQPLIDIRIWLENELT